MGRDAAAVRQDRRDHGSDPREGPITWIPRYALLSRLEEQVRPEDYRITYELEDHPVLHYRVRLTIRDRGVIDPVTGEPSEIVKDEVAEIPSLDFIDKETGETKLRTDPLKSAITYADRRVLGAALGLTWDLLRWQDDEKYGRKRTPQESPDSPAPQDRPQPAESRPAPRSPEPSPESTERPQASPQGAGGRGAGGRGGSG